MNVSFSRFFCHNYLYLSANLVITILVSNQIGSDNDDAAEICVGHRLSLYLNYFIKDTFLLIKFVKVMINCIFIQIKVK